MLYVIREKTPRLPLTPKGGLATVGEGVLNKLYEKKIALSFV